MALSSTAPFWRMAPLRNEPAPIRVVSPVGDLGDQQDVNVPAVVANEYECLGSVRNVMGVL